MNIVTLTMNPTIDTNTRVKQVNPEQKLRCEKPHHEPGGGGINVSRAIHKLGGESLSIFTAGSSNGEMFKKLLSRDGIQQKPVPIRELTRENLTVYEQTSGNQYRFVMPGPELIHKEWEECLKIIRGLNPHPTFIVASGSLPPGVPEDFYGRVASLGREIDARLVLDTTGTPLQQAVETGVFMIKPNMREMKQLTGKEIEDESHLKEVAGEIISRGKSRVIVISLGAAGALMVSKQERIHLRAPTVRIKSKVGAGDSMVAGIVLSLSRGNSLLNAVKFGVAAGAAAVMTPGTELCRRKDTEYLFEKMNS